MSHLPSLRLGLLVALAVTGLAATLPAADKEPLALKYDTFPLTDGRTLTKVVIKSYDPKGEKLLLLADGRALILPVALVPDPLGTRLKEEAPKSGATTTSTQERKVYAPVAVPGSNGARTFSQPVLNADEKVQKHREAARRTAETQLVGTYMRDGARTWKVAQCEMQEPVPVEGWIDRYRSTGVITLDFFDAKGAKLRSITRHVEVVTEKPPLRSVAMVLSFVEKE